MDRRGITWRDVAVAALVVLQIIFVTAMAGAVGELKSLHENKADITTVTAAIAQASALRETKVDKSEFNGAIAALNSKLDLAIQLLRDHEMNTRKMMGAELYEYYPTRKNADKHEAVKRAAPPAR